MTEYTVPIHMGFDWIIVLYFFIAGIGAGSFLLAVCSDYWIKDFKPLAPTARVIAPLATATGLLLLLFHLGQPLRFWRLLVTFTPNAAISWGVWFLNIFFLLGAGYAWFQYKKSEIPAKITGYGGLLFALLVAVYSSLLLGQSPDKELWNNSLLPVLFVVGGIISGFSLVLLLAVSKCEKAVFVKAGKITAWLILLELVLTGVELLFMANGGTESLSVLHALLTGEFSQLFLVGQILIGSLVPMIILFKLNVNATTQRLASLLILSGVFIMRYIIIIGGQIIN